MPRPHAAAAAALAAAALAAPAAQAATVQLLLTDRTVRSVSLTTRVAGEAPRIRQARADDYRPFRETLTQAAEAGGGASATVASEVSERPDRSVVFDLFSGIRLDFDPAAGEDSPPVSPEASTNWQFSLDEDAEARFVIEAAATDFLSTDSLIVGSLFSRDGVDSSTSPLLTGRGLGGFNPEEATGQTRTLLFDETGILAAGSYDLASITSLDTFGAAGPGFADVSVRLEVFDSDLAQPIPTPAALGGGLTLLLGLAARRRRRDA